MLTNSTQGILGVVATGFGVKWFMLCNRPNLYSIDLSVMYAIDISFPQKLVGNRTAIS